MAKIVEAFQHADAGGGATSIVKYGVAAADYLASRYQNRRALAVLERVAETVSAGSTATRVRVGLQIAALHARLGSFERGIQALTELLSSSPPPKGVSRSRILLHLAVLHSRRGEFQRAAGLFEECIPEHGSPRGLEAEEVLHFVNEFAALRGFTGDYDGARELYDRGQELARGSRARRTRRVVLDLHSTRATVALRTFRFSEAIRHLDKALGIAESLGSQTNRAVVLNNLGIVYGQCDRYVEAIRAFEEAETTCQRLEEGAVAGFDLRQPCRAVLQTRRFFANGERTRASGTIDSGLDERSAEHVLSARPAASRSSTQGAMQRRDRISRLRRALRRRWETGTWRSFDRVYLGEALVFLGEYGEASRVLDEFVSMSQSGRWKAMALARLSYLFALTARPDESRQLALEHSEEAPERPDPVSRRLGSAVLGMVCVASR